MAFTETMIDTPRKRPSLLDALAAAHSNPASGGISIRGVGDDIRADVPDDDAYAQNLDVQSTAPGMSRGDTASSFLSGRLSEIAGNYDRNQMDEATKVQRLKNAAAMEAQRGQAAIYNDPVIRKMQDEQFQRQMQLKQLDVQSKVLPEQIRANASLSAADRTASGREAASSATARTSALNRQLETLYRLRYPANGGLRPAAPSSTGWLGGNVPGPRNDQDSIDALDSRISALNRQLDTDDGLYDEDPTSGGSLPALLDQMRRRGGYAQP